MYMCRKECELCRKVYSKSELCMCVSGRGVIIL